MAELSCTIAGGRGKGAGVDEAEGTARERVEERVAIREPRSDACLGRRSTVKVHRDFLLREEPQATTR